MLYAFDAEAEGELSVAVGDSLWVQLSWKSPHCQHHPLLLLLLLLVLLLLLLRTLPAQPCSILAMCRFCSHCTIAPAGARAVCL
jgi:hypothetical protein